MIARYSAAVLSWSFAPIAYDWRGPSKLPFGAFTLFCTSDVRMSSSPSPSEERAAGLMRTRTAGFWFPSMVTRPTPVTSLNFCASTVSA